MAGVEVRSAWVGAAFMTGQTMSPGQAEAIMHQISIGGPVIIKPEIW
jgi:hypothetical protein